MSDGFDKLSHRYVFLQSIILFLTAFLQALAAALYKNMDLPSFGNLVSSYFYTVAELMQPLYGIAGGIASTRSPSVELQEALQALAVPLWNCRRRCKSVQPFRGIAGGGARACSLILKIKKQ